MNLYQFRAKVTTEMFKLASANLDKNILYGRVKKVQEHYSKISAPSNISVIEDEFTFRYEFTQLLYKLKARKNDIPECLKGKELKWNNVKFKVYL